MPAVTPDERSRFALNTYSFTQKEPAADCVSRQADAGYREFELMMYPGHFWPPSATPADRGALRQTLERRNLTIRTLNQPNIDINLAAATEEMRAHSLRIVCDIVDLAGELTAPGVIIGPGKANPLLPAPREALLTWFFQALDLLVPRAEAAGTRILVENMPFCFLPDAERLMAALERYGCDEIGVVYDVANAAFIGEDLAAGIHLTRARLHTVHLSDTARDIYRHAPIGEGTVPFPAALAALVEIGFKDRAVLEIITHDPDRDLDRSVAALSTMGWGS